MRQNTNKIYIYKMRVDLLYNWLPTPNVGLILLPFGEYYNRKLLTLRRGDYIQFQNEQRNMHGFLSLCKLDLRTSAAGLLCDYIYGISVRDMVMRWKNTAVIEGYTKLAVNSDKCLLMSYQMYPQKYVKVKGLSGESRR